MRVIDIQKMALHALGKNKIQTALTMLGIVIGVSAVIAMVSLGQGAQKLVQDQVAGMGTNVLQVQGGGGWNQGGGARHVEDECSAQREGGEKYRHRSCVPAEHEGDGHFASRDVTRYHTMSPPERPRIVPLLDASGGAADAWYGCAAGAG